MHLYNLTPEALTVLVAAIVAAALLTVFFLYPRFRRIKDTWDGPTSFAWRCPECGAADVFVAKSYEAAKAEAPVLHDRMLAENAPILLKAYIHNVLVNQET
jgi:hypothetical protein